MTTSHPAAALLAVDATRRRLSAPDREPQSRGRHRAAQVLVSAARRLDPQVVAIRPSAAH